MPGATAPAAGNIAGRGRRRRERAERAERAEVARLGGTRRTVALRRHASSDTDEMIILDDDEGEDNNNNANGGVTTDIGTGATTSASASATATADAPRVRQRASDLPFGSDIGRIVAASSSGGDTDDERIMDNLFGEMLGAGMDTSVGDDPVYAKAQARAQGPSSIGDAPPVAIAASAVKRTQDEDEEKDEERMEFARPAKRGRVIIDSDDE